MKDKYITGILNKYIGLRDIAIADLSVYIENPVGVGEHSNIGDEIEKKLKEVADCNEMIETITKYFSANQNDESEVSENTD